jgi:hypothetical protein
MPYFVFLNLLKIFVLTKKNNPTASKIIKIEAD